jgi:hypothetical protein
MPTLNDHLTEVEFQLEKYRGITEADFLTRRNLLRTLLIKWGDNRYQDGYGDGRRDVFETRQLARDAEEKAAREEADGD